ncbi:MAG TPA: SDR family oxidoreductase [Pilimelia sp.]|nr:SDR family oxidoreductase [Pilimelia sp.]
MPRPVTLVTGGSRGIGAATADRLARDGHDVAICYRVDAGAARQVAEAVRQHGARCLAIQADTADADAVARMFDQVAAELGELTGLVNNAGVTGPIGRLADVPIAELRRVVDVNVVGYLLCAQQAARRMTRGAIVNVSSGAATTGSPDEYVHYAATKAAVDTLTIGLAKELAGAGIRVNAVAPGITSTDIHAAAGEPDRPVRLASRIPLGRAGEPDEIAAAIAWLLGPEASYVTGAVLRVAGGY